MKFIDFLKGFGAGIIWLAGMKVYDPIFENKPFNTSIGWIEILIVISFGAFYYLYRNKIQEKKSTD
jgi:hypothetical protein